MAFTKAGYSGVIPFAYPSGAAVNGLVVTVKDSTGAAAVLYTDATKATLAGSTFTTGRAFAIAARFISRSTAA